MRIRGYFKHTIEPKALFIDATLISKRLNLEYKISFLIDTGASSTIVLDKDFKESGLNIQSLRELEKI